MRLPLVCAAVFCCFSSSISVDGDTFGRPKAAFVMLIKGDYQSVSVASQALRSIERALNNVYKYPLVLFHSGMDARHHSVLTSNFSGEIFFHKVDFQTPPLPRGPPPDEIEGFRGRVSSMGYRHMCRFFSGAVFQHDAVADFDFLWRIDSDASYICKIDYDPFEYMNRRGYKYGHVITMYEEPRIAATTLWKATQEFMTIQNIQRGAGFPSLPVDPDYFGEITDLYGGYDRCHYWNNFEILDLRFFRSKEYQSYFRHLDAGGGFYYYRWGDALVRTIGVNMLLKKSEVKQFNDIGYEHQGICVNPCGATGVGCKTELADGVTGYCKYYHSKICTWENQKAGHVVIIIGLVGTLVTALLIWLRFVRHRWQSGAGGSGAGMQTLLPFFRTGYSPDKINVKSN